MLIASLASDTRRLQEPEATLAIVTEPGLEKKGEREREKKGKVM